MESAEQLSGRHQGPFEVTVKAQVEFLNFLALHWMILAGAIYARASTFRVQQLGK